MKKGITSSANIENEASISSLPMSRLLYAVIFLMPFLMLNWMIPFFSDATLGKDYTNVYIRQQMELMFSLKTGSFPLFMPDFAAGQAAVSLTMGQLFHPIPHMAAHLPAYWSGYALEWVTLLKLLSLIGSQMMLFAFLKKLAWNHFSAGSPETAGLQKTAKPPISS